MNKSDIVDVPIINSFSRINKRAQFFLLAAVIISAVIISLGIGTNKVVVSEEPTSFYDFSYEVKREVGAVLDYEVYSGFDSDVNLGDFVDLLADEITERSPGSNFIFIYGNGSATEGNWQIKNYGSESVYVEGEEVEGLNSEDTSRICLSSSCKEIEGDMGEVSDFQMNTDRILDDDILVEIEGNEFSFEPSPHRQVIFIMIKNVGSDRHVIVE
jgi:hypothetical protein